MYAEGVCRKSGSGDVGLLPLQLEPEPEPGVCPFDGRGVGVEEYGRVKGDRGDGEVGENGVFMARPFCNAA